MRNFELVYRISKKISYAFKVGIIYLNISCHDTLRADSGTAIIPSAFTCRTWINQSNIARGYNLRNVFRVREAKPYEVEFMTG